MHFKVKAIYLTALVHKENPIKDSKNANTDILVHIEEEESERGRKICKYIASCFTYKNIEELRALHNNTGEYQEGRYFYAKNMILVDDCSLSNIRSIINYLIDEGEFREVFRKI